MKSLQSKGTLNSADPDTHHHHQATNACLIDATWLCFENSCTKVKNRKLGFAKYSLVNHARLIVLQGKVEYQHWLWVRPSFAWESSISDRLYLTLISGIAPPGCHVNEDSNYLKQRLKRSDSSVDWWLNRYKTSWDFLFPVKLEEEVEFAWADGWLMDWMAGAERFSPATNIPAGLIPDLRSCRGNKSHWSGN